jgi:solute carrier family 25 protein 38
MQEKREGRRLVTAFTAGGLSATCSTLMFQPLDLVKTRMQMRALAAPLCLATATVQGGAASVGMVGTFVHVVQRENITGLWRGTSPSLQRSIPGIGLYFASLTFLKSRIGKSDKDLRPIEALSMGVTARSFTAACCTPMTVVKTRFESGRFQYRSVVDALTNIATTEGPKGLFRGLSATLARDAPFSGLYLLFYTQAKQLAMRATNSDTLAPSLLFSCGVAAGLAASIITQPADVVKTSVQTKTLPSAAGTGLLPAISSIYQTRGLRAMFAGIAPRVTRRTLMAAFTWAFYEQIVLLVDNRFNRNTY